MTTTRKTITDKAGRTIEMRSTPDRPYDPAFDSYLVLHENGVDNHTLTLVLKVHMNRVAPTRIRLLGRTMTLRYPDFDKTLFTIKPWSPWDFAAFKKEYLRHAAHWNNNFWLIPPASFTALDYKRNGKTIRPNIYCHLHIDILDTPAGSHRSLDIINLDKRATARQLGKRQRDLNASDFRSDDRHYDSLDGKPVPLPFKDDNGVTHKLNRSTIAHEIGHALGLPHAGVPHKAPLCAAAVVANNLFPGSASSFPAIIRGGSNSQACYGSEGPLKVGANVMGYGLEFDETNAAPWLDRIALHTSTKAADWKVSLKTKVAPKVV